MSPLLSQVRELLGRNLDAIEISRRLHIDVEIVQLAIQQLLS